MSSFDITAAQETQFQKDKGVEAYLSQEERENLQRMLSFPEDFPTKFGAWLQDYISVNASLSRSQVIGLSQFTANYDRVVTTESRGNTSFGDLATVGPRIDGLSDGTYVLLFGATILASGTTAGIMGVSLNGATATDNDAAHAPNAPSTPATGVLASLSNDNNNSVVAKYRTVGGSVSFARRWLIALKVGN